MSEQFLTSLSTLLASSLFPTLPSPPSLYMMCLFPLLFLLRVLLGAPSLEGFQTSPWQIVAASGHPQHLTVALWPAVVFCYHVFILGSYLRSRPASASI